jgi:hypothetical protein
VQRSGWITGTQVLCPNSHISLRISWQSQKPTVASEDTIPPLLLLLQCCYTAGPGWNISTRHFQKLSEDKAEINTKCNVNPGHTAFKIGCLSSFVFSPECLPTFFLGTMCRSPTPTQTPSMKTLGTTRGLKFRPKKEGSEKQPLSLLGWPIQPFHSVSRAAISKMTDITNARLFRKDLLPHSHRCALISCPPQEIHIQTL